MICINMNAPKCCADCPMFHEGTTYDQLYTRCEAVHTDGNSFGNSLMNFNYRAGRPNWCPIVETNTKQNSVQVINFGT